MLPRNRLQGIQIAFDEGLSKVLDSGLSTQTVVPAKAGIQDILTSTTCWIPAFAGMTDELWKDPACQVVAVGPRSPLGYNRQAFHTAVPVEPFTAEVKRCSI